MSDVRGASTLPGKSKGWLTSQGMLSESELNQAVRDFSSPVFSRPWVDYDEQWVKWNSGSEQADAMYRHVQQHSRHLRDAGSSLVRSDLMALRDKAGEPSWVDAPDGRGAGR